MLVWVSLLCWVLHTVHRSLYRTDQLAVCAGLCARSAQRAAGMCSTANKFTAMLPAALHCATVAAQDW